MKTITSREFYHTPALVNALPPGKSLVVSDNGKPKFIVTKAGKRPRRTAADLEREARDIFPGERPQVDLTAALKSLKK